MADHTAFLTNQLAAALDAQRLATERVGEITAELIAKRDAGAISQAQLNGMMTWASQDATRPLPGAERASRRDMAQRFALAAEMDR